MNSLATSMLVFTCGVMVGLLAAPPKVIVLPDNPMVVERPASLIPVQCCGMLEPDINTQVELEYQQLLRDEDASLNQSFNSSLTHSKDAWRSVFPDQPCSR